MNPKLVSLLTTSQWLLEPTWAETHLPLLLHTMMHEQTLPKSEPAYLCLTSQGGTFQANRYALYDQAPSNSIALIGIQGAIFKYGYDYEGYYGTEQYTSYLKKAMQSDKITGILLKIDTPGGQVDGTATLADAIAACVAANKPVVALVNDGMCASAGYWLASRGSEIWASQKTDKIGSIGVYTTLVDSTTLNEKWGIKIQEVYARQSKDKNKPYRDAMKGDVSAIEDAVSFVADQFIAGVKTYRGDKLKTDKENPFTGKLYTAEKALEIGLIDHIGSIEQAVARVYELSSSSSSSNSSTKSQTNNAMSLAKKWNALMGSMGLTALIVGETDQINEANLQALADQTKQFQSEATQLRTQLSAVNEQLTAAQTAKTDAETKLTTAQQQLTASEAEVTRLKGLVPGANQTNPLLQGGDPNPGGSQGNQDTFQIDPTASHYQFITSRMGS